MSNYCTSCMKFVSLEQGEDNEADVDASGSDLTGSIHQVINCAECGQPLKETNHDVYLDLTEWHDCRDEDQKDPEGPDYIELEYSYQDAEIETTERMQTTDRNGNPIKNMRYMKKFYGVNVTFQCTCSKCHEEFEVTESFEEQASGFNPV